jgi:hypothetical protein
VFTQYDRVLYDKSKTVEDKNQILESCIESLRSTCCSYKMDTPSYVFASTKTKYIPDDLAGQVNLLPQPKDGNLVELASRTREIVEGDAWLIWATTQRKSISLKIEACVE